MGCGLCPEETQRPFGGHRPGLWQGRLHQVRARSQAAHVTAPWWPGLSRGVVSLLPPLPPAGSRTVASTRPSSLRGVSTPTRTIWMGSSLPSSRNSPMPSRRHRKVTWCWSSAELAGPALAGCFPPQKPRGFSQCLSLVSDEEPAAEAAAPSAVPDTVTEPPPKKKKLEGSNSDKEQKLPQPALKKKRSLQAQRRPLKAVRPSPKMMRPKVPTRKKKHRVKANGQ